jgi:hypothetical protein
MNEWMFKCDSRQMALFTKCVHIASILFLEVYHLHRTWIGLLTLTVVILKAWYL